MIFSTSRNPKPQYIIYILLIGIFLFSLIGCSSADPLTETTYNLDGYTYYADGEWVNVNEHASTHENGGSDDLHLGRSATIVIASHNATTLEKLQADYVCDGTNDEVQILAAIAAIPSGGKIHFSTGTFIADEPILTGGIHNIVFEGCGYSTYIKSSENVTWTTGVEGADALFDTSGSDEITFRNLRLYINTNTVSGECIDADRATNMLVERCYLQVAYEGCAVNFDGEGETASENKFVYNVVETYDNGVIVMAKAGNNYRTIIQGNIFKGWNNTDNGTSAIVIGVAGYDAYPSNVLIDSNIIGNDTSFDYAGVRLWQSDNVTITNNHIRVNTSAVGIRFESASATLVTGNNMLGNTTPINANYLTIDPLAIVRDNMGIGSDTTWWNLLKEERIFTPSTSGGWLTGGSGSAIQWPTQLQARTSGAVTLCNEYIYTPPIGMGIGQQIDWDEDLYFYTPSFIPVHADPTNEISRIQWRQTTAFNAADAAERAIGIEVSGANLDLIVESHDGTTRSEYDTGTNLTHNRPYALEIVYLAGTGIYVYIDGELQGSPKTNNLPSGNGGLSRWGISVVRNGGASTVGSDGPIITSPVFKSTYRP